jgi:hypothetical protein
MFRKILAAATTALVAGALTLGAAAAPAFADGTDPSTTTDQTTASAPAADPAATAPAADPAPSAPAPAPSDSPASTTPAPPTTPAPDAAPVVAPPAATTAPAADAPALQGTKCLPPSAVSYTYDNTYFDGTPANQGVITVHQLDPTVYSDTLCYGFWVLATGWVYDTTGTWPQTLEGSSAANGGEEITKVGPGTYPYGFPVTCGQGDIYASWNGPIKLPTKLTESSPDIEHFLSQMGFVREDGNPNDTWMTTDPSCHVINQDIVAPSVTATATCTTPGSLSWTDIPGEVVYSLTSGNGKTGLNTVTATAQGNWIFPDNTKTRVFKDIDLGTPTDCPAIPGDPTSSPAVCTNGVTGLGSITVGYQPGVLEYTVTPAGGSPVPITQATTPEPVGSYTVHVAAVQPGFALPASAGTGWTLIGPNDWRADVTVGAPVDCADLPTDADFSIEWTATNAGCSTGTGTITVGPAEFAGFVNFFIDGKPVNPGVAVRASAGNHLVTATPVDPADTVDNSPQTASVPSASAACPTQLKTLALTGTDPSSQLIAAGVLLPAGVLLLLGAALIRRRHQQ